MSMLRLYVTLYSTVSLLFRPTSTANLFGYLDRGNHSRLETQLPVELFWQARSFRKTARKMPYTNEDYLPSYEELTVPELEITSAVFRTAAHHMGKYCDNVCKEFMLCRAEEKDPRKCLNEGKAVTRCGFEFLGKVKKSCFAEFNQYMQCIDHSGSQMEFKNCRKTQETYDNCIKEKLGQERPNLGYFAKVRLHQSDRPKPAIKPHILPERVDDPPDFSKEPSTKHGPGYWSG